MREAGIKEKGRAKTERIPIKIVRASRSQAGLDRVRAPGPNSRFHRSRTSCASRNAHGVRGSLLPEHRECFGKGTATFMILGDLCTRRCPFCDVAHGRPLAPDGKSRGTSRRRFQG